MDAALALRAGGFSNREIARLLGVNESTVRRALAAAPPPPNYVGPAEQRFEIIVRPL